MKNDTLNLEPKQTHKPSTTVGSVLIDQVKRRIESFHAVESHYCRASTKRTYLDSTLSVKKMHQLHVNKMAEDSLPVVMYWKYNDIFTKDYHLGFHTPKQDICDKCTKHGKTC